MTNEDLDNWVLEALDSLGGEGHIVEIAKYIWENKRSELEANEKDFFTWQYRMRKSGQRLYRDGRLDRSSFGRLGVWALATEDQGSLAEGDTPARDTADE